MQQERHLGTVQADTVTLAVHLRFTAGHQSDVQVQRHLGTVQRHRRLAGNTLQRLTEFRFLCLQ